MGGRNGDMADKGSREERRPAEDSMKEQPGYSRNRKKFGVAGARPGMKCLVLTVEKA